MRNLISLNDLTNNELFDLFERADYFKRNPYEKRFANKCFVLFFLESSIRTRVTFEKGINNLGGQSILFDSETLKKKESHEDVFGYLNNWADCIIVRHYDIHAIQKMTEYSNCPIINGLSDRKILFNPCPPFYRGEEVSADAIKSDYFVGYDFKKSLLNVQQAIIDFCMQTESL